MEVGNQVHIRMSEGLTGRLPPVRGSVISHELCSGSTRRVLVIESDEGEELRFDLFSGGGYWRMLREDETGNWVRQEHGNSYTITVCNTIMVV